MVCSTKRPTISDSPTTVPADATLRNVFNHFADQRLGRVLKHCGRLGRGTAVRLSVRFWPFDL
jgi:hypothetical protein